MVRTCGTRGTYGKICTMQYVQLNISYITLMEELCIQGFQPIFGE